MIDKSKLFSTNVQAKDITFDAEGFAHIRSAALLNTLVHSTPHVIQKLEMHVTPVVPDDITIDDDGRLVISNPDFNKTLRARMTLETADDTNYVCKNAYSCGAL